ncbi:hypothetical protein G6F57_004069 [Rhizopus arrhizus]|uniref:Uncharacterized protein n=1 Tax=Rhizopus oryzae TaxID=64495 RepID=A0A9P6XKJ0_RHIOR|nr:hypothetical protein G6F23_005563 [Rhizopus arrhizus]KAG1415657.1 hypothetical protein G6F58_006380 [Rhizopus delemar]KAG0758427.1 hypothetical protein G6F24_009809 [Rhizopus arrhizus]KAG0784591.1 hypothetical protein G6F21_009805 [Rhizopus arrhizus]KAG0798911.1 hypothetical protein G6F22_003750 [Rhizopus arrhizus]
MSSVQKTTTSTTTISTPTPKDQSKLSKFLLDPWSTAKVAIPSAACSLILYKTCVSKASLRELTLSLTALNAIWFATITNVAFLETPLLAAVPSLDEWQKVDICRHRISWMNKLETKVSLLNLGLLISWNDRIVKNNGFVDNMLKAAAVAPIAITVIQSAYFTPRLNKRAIQIGRGEAMVEGVYDHQSPPLTGLVGYIALDAIKVAALAVAGLRFGLMLKN